MELMRFRRGIGAFARGLGLGRNALRRRADRVESAILLAVLAGFAVGVPAVAIQAARWSYESERPARAGEPVRHTVSAVLAMDAPMARPMLSRTGEEDRDRLLRPLVPARWVFRGVRHSGPVPAGPGTPAGTRVPIVVDDAGAAVYSPAPGIVLALAVMSGVAAGVVAALLLVYLWWLVRWVFVRRQLAAWGAEWAAVAREWSEDR